MQEPEKFDDKLWSSLISKHPDFATLAAKTATRQDYCNWINQHESWASWSFESYQSKSLKNINEKGVQTNGIAIIVGTFGEMKGAVQCEKNV